MGVSNGPAGRPADHARPVHDGEPSSLAPRWTADGAARPRKVVPLRIPSAPQLVPATSDPAASAASTTPATSAAARMGPELLAQDAVLKRLLDSAPPDPQPPAVQPMRDPVGLALGMVARLIVAASAAAGVAMLLFGVVPLPFRGVPPAVSEATTGSVMMQPSTVATERVVKSAQRPGDSQIIDQAADQAAAALPAPAPVATSSAHAVPASEPPAVETGEVERLVKRGEELLALGDIAAARLVLGRAAGARDARATYALAQTFDPDVLRRLHVVGFRPDLARARDWYEKAAGYGSGEAAARLNALPRDSAPLNSR
jgi:hypothetical protein